MKVTLYLNKSDGGMLEVKNKIRSVLNPDHIIFDHWDGGELEKEYLITGKDGYTYKAKVRSKELAVAEYIEYCNGEKDGKIFQNYAQALSWDQLVATFNNHYAIDENDKIVSIEEV